MGTLLQGSVVFPSRGSCHCLQRIVIITRTLWQHDEESYYHFLQAWLIFQNNDGFDNTAILCNVLTKQWRGLNLLRSSAAWLRAVLGHNVTKNGQSKLTHHYWDSFCIYGYKIDREMHELDFGNHVYAIDKQYAFAVKSCYHGCMIIVLFFRNNRVTLSHRIRRVSN